MSVGNTQFMATESFLSSLGPYNPLGLYTEQKVFLETLHCVFYAVVYKPLSYLPAVKTKDFSKTITP